MNLPCSHKKKRKKGRDTKLYEQSWQSVPHDCLLTCQLVNEGVCLFVVLSAFFPNFWQSFISLHLASGILLTCLSWVSHVFSTISVFFTVCKNENDNHSSNNRFDFLGQKKKSNRVCFFVCWVEVIVMFNTQVVFFVVLILKEKGGKYSHSHQKNKIKEWPQMLQKKWFAKCSTIKVLHLISFSQKVDQKKRTIKKFFQELLIIIFFCQLLILKNHFFFVQHLRSFSHF